MQQRPDVGLWLGTQRSSLSVAPRRRLRNRRRLGVHTRGAGGAPWSPLALIHRPYSTHIAHDLQQIHYLRPPTNASAAGTTPTDSSGVILHITTQPVAKAAGILMFATSFVIPPRTPDFHVAMECCYDGPQPLTAVAFRVHTHALGRLVWLERGRQGVAAWDHELLGNDGLADTNPGLLLRRSPLLPQAFNLVSDQPGAHNPGQEEGGGDAYVNAALPGPLVVQPGTMLRATCRFDSTEVDHAVRSGNTHGDEMCNLYLLYSAEAPAAMACYDAAGNDVATESGPVPPQPTSPDARLSALHLGWAPGKAGPTGKGLLADDVAISHVAGVDLSPDKSVLWVFHRAGRAWDGATFNDATNRMRDESPITADAVVALDVATGAPLSTWGGGSFLMPHAVTVDAWGHIWLVDCGLHQVLKYSTTGQRMLAIGNARTPGSGPAHLCKPTAVAVATDGSFFIADGYCNSRIVAYSANGTFRGEWSPEASVGPMNVPHDLVLDECANALHIADRENGRVLTLNGILTGPPTSWRTKDAAGLPYGIDRAPGGDIYALCWARNAMGGGPTRMARLSGGRAARGWAAGSHMGAAPASVWDVADSNAPHAVAVAVPPGGGPGLVVFVGETRATSSGGGGGGLIIPGVTSVIAPAPKSEDDGGGSNASTPAGASPTTLMSTVTNAAAAALAMATASVTSSLPVGPGRYAIGDVNPCAWKAACGDATSSHAGATSLTAALRSHTPGVGPGWAPSAQSRGQRQRVMLTRAALFLAVLFIVAAAAMPSAQGARMILPGANREKDKAGAGGGAKKGTSRMPGTKHAKARHSEVPLDTVLAELHAEQRAAAGEAGEARGSRDEVKT